MEFNLVWHEPLALQPSDDQIYSADHTKIPDAPGVYVFLRVFGSNHRPLYVGKAENLQQRIRQQLNSVKLMKHLQNAENGARRVAFAEFHPKKSQQIDKCLRMIERTLIRHFLSQGCDLFNTQGTRIKQHTIVSNVPPPKKKHFVPKTLKFQ